jgi:Transposase domain (DUF772)
LDNNTKTQKALTPILAPYWNNIQSRLFPVLEEHLNQSGEVLSAELRQLASILEVVRIEQHVQSPDLRRRPGRCGRPAHDRRPIARAFVAKAALNIPTTKDLRAMLLAQPALRQICGWEMRRHVPSEAVFSRTFRDFAQSALADQVHAALVEAFVGDQVVMHVSRDSTAILAREKAVKKEKPFPRKSPYKRGRPKKGEVRPPRPIAPSRLPRQMGQTPEEAIAELPMACSFGCKGDSSGRGQVQYWKGYKMHIDWADGSLPLTVITTSANLDDSQAAIPLARLTARRVTSLYDLMDCRHARVTARMTPHKSVRSAPNSAMSL